MRYWLSPGMIFPHIYGEAKIRASGSLSGWGSLGHINNHPYESNKCRNS